MKKSTKFIAAELLTITAFLTIGVSSVSASGYCLVDYDGNGVCVENVDLGGTKCQLSTASGLNCSQSAK